VASRRPTGAGLRAKRLLDVVLAGSALIATFPLMLVLALAIRITMGGPILFRQQRPGLGGKPFTMLKFRSMLPPDAGDPKPPSHHDFDMTRRRVTPVGYWLRRTSMDELPELWNVLLGDMSLVGPRPLLMEYLPHYTAEQMRRHEMRPGVTGLAQVRGRHALDWGDRFRYDNWYVDHWSLRLDTRIMIDTLKVLMRSSGQSDYATGSEPPRFDAITSLVAASPNDREPTGVPMRDMEE
jgi:lipopolysaccharide/colanic/teichoic acid biosynthesis glycosyltransferase